MSTTTSALTSLLETCMDDQEGFLTAAQNVKDGELKLLFSEIAMQRLQFAEELRGLLSGLGQTPEPSGTLAGAFHRAWMQLKASLTGGDEHEILAACERSEQATMSKYRDILEKQELTPDIEHVVREQLRCLKPVQRCVSGLRVELRK